MSDKNSRGPAGAPLLPRPRSSQPGIFVCPHCLKAFFAPPMRGGDPHCRFCGKNRYDLRPTLVRHHRCPRCGVWLLCRSVPYEGGAGRPVCPRCSAGLPVSVVTCEGTKWRTVVQVIEYGAGANHPGPHVRTPIGACLFCGSGAG